MKTMKSSIKQAGYALLAALFTLVSILPAGAGETTQTSADPPAFQAHVKWSGGNGYIVMGTFTEFASDITGIQPMYSLDGLSYLPCEYMDWDLRYNPEDADELQKLQNQICLVSNMEPLAGYLAEDLDHFWLKLRITKENGASYETQAAVIDRGTVQPLPEGISATLMFSTAMLARKMNPYRLCGSYQITVSENASPEEIAAYLPDTVPVAVTFQNSGTNAAFTECVLDCPITWKPLSFASLTPGESVTIEDAAEPVIIPAGTVLRTPLGAFCPDEALGFDKPYSSDEIDLVLNVVKEAAAPSGALSTERDGLELAFDLKPTGATAIQVYTCTEDDTQWTQLSGSFPLDVTDSQPGTQNSGYALILGNDTEPYSSFLAQKETGNPTPFFVGIKIEGGVYDGKQLILPWPADYDLPLNLPKLTGSGGNENNAGSDDKNDSTDEGQRPNLPENPSGSSGTSGPAGGQPSEPGSGTQTRPETPDMTKPGTPDPQPPDTTEPEQSDPQLPDATKPEQSDPQPADTAKPEQSDPQPADAAKPEQSDPQPANRPKPERPSEQQPAQNTSKNTKTSSSNPAKESKTDAGKESGTGSETRTAKTSVTDSKTSASKSSTAEDKTDASTASTAEDKTDAAAAPAADKSVPADNPLHPDKKMLTAQNSSAEAGVDRELQQVPDRESESDRSSPVLPIIAAAACFGACIAAVKKTPKI